MRDGRDQREAATVSTTEISRHPFKLWMPHREGNNSESISLSPPILPLSLSFFQSPPLFSISHPSLPPSLARSLPPSIPPSLRPSATLPPSLRPSHPPSLFSILNSRPSMFLDYVSWFWFGVMLTSPFGI